MIRTTLAIAALACVGAAAHAASTPPQDAVRAAVMKLAPNAKIDAIEPAPIAGFQQVLMGGQLVYVSNDGRYLMQGGLYDSTNKTDLTDQRLAKARVAKLAEMRDAIDSRLANPILYARADPGPASGSPRSRRRDPARAREAPPARSRGRTAADGRGSAQA